MIRWPNYKEAVAWLRSSGQGPTSFYMWGSIYVQRAEWSGTGWRWLTEAELRKTAGLAA